MKRLLQIPLQILLLCSCAFFSSVVMADDYAEGMQLFQNQQYEDAVSRFTKAAEEGNLKAQTFLGRLYDTGYRNIAQDQGKALYWMEKAAKQGDASAQSALALMYFSNQEGSIAVYWLRQAAEQDHVRSQRILGLLYGKGIGAKQDDRQAVYWMEKAAKQGDMQGQYYLGTLYEAGSGVPADAAKAQYWYEKAAEQGHGKAIEKLAGK